MDISNIQTVIFIIIMGATLVAMIRGENHHQRSKEALTMAEEDLTDQTPTPSMMAKVTASISSLDIKKNADGVIEQIKGIPLSVVPNGTLGEMTKAIRDYAATRATGAKMRFDMAAGIAADILRLRQSKEAVEPEEPKLKANDGLTIVPKPKDESAA